ncbi:hypothetical protein DPMN_176350 [Dreissena polymorpha]|uniref:HD domain-containing protein n=2 Tax=Dreissena polymorpha TaxID=45954 RepID=A0A9D4E9C4_DREPO|nr:hypothetical protein DPMN_176350 [Dreissena polymorpha]
MDTPEFQRLRFIKQLGPVYFVYPGAAQNIFEHSLGVCHLAGRLVKTLQNNQPELEITDADVLCLEIAGLCHDLGHGPFSHLFQYSFLPKMWPDLKWTHEENSVKMFDYLITKNNLIKYFEEYHISERDREFIREIIARPDVASMKSTRPEKYPNERKMFLYKIVSNKRNGIDVDKWDYLHGIV